MAYDQRVSDMFRPLTVRSMTVRNRFAMAPMTRSSSPDGIPGADVADYYARRAAGGVGLIITEGVRVPDPAAGWPNSIPTLAGYEVLEGWRAVTGAVHTHGAAIAAQLWHQGAERDERDGVVAVSPSGLNGRGESKGRGLRTDELAEVAESYAAAGRNAREVGFDAVELHGAHGYLLDEFLWGKTNLRGDRYGGELGDRTRFPAEVVAAVRAAVGPDFPIIYRFSQWKQSDYAASIAEDPARLQDLLGPLVDAGVDMFHPSTRRHYQPAFPDADPVLSLGGWTKKVTGVPVIAVGSVGLETEFTPGMAGGPISPAPLDRLLDQFASGEFDVAALGRALLADATWVNRLRDDSLDGFNGFDAQTALAGLN
jgi:2,4-dienoyl-CoA reductase-like NADH-dependent reductase (Old Yellow Enzyme family)